MNARTTPPAYDPAWGFEVAPPPAANLAAVDISGIFQPQLQPQPPRLIGQPSVASVQSVASFGGLPYASSVAQPSVASVDTSEQSFGGLPYASSVATASLASGVSSPGRECVLCLSAPRTIRLEPCGHGCLCEECLKRLSENGSPSCPICMAPIAGYHQGVVGREATFVPASSAARQGPLTRLNTARLQARESMLQPVRRMFSGEERPSWFALLFFFLLMGAYIALWALPIISIAGIESYASSIEEARCHAVVVGCSMTCGNTIRQVDKNDENSHEVQSPCKDCRGEQLLAAGASLSERCEWAAPLMPVLKEAQCGSNYTLRVAVKVEGEGSASAEQTNQVNCIIDGKILPWEDRRYHEEETQVDICLSGFVGAVQVCEPGTVCAAGAGSEGGQGQETKCYRDRDGRLFLTRPEKDNIMGWVCLLVFMALATCGTSKE